MMIRSNRACRVLDKVLSRMPGKFSDLVSPVDQFRLATTFRGESAPEEGDIQLYRQKGVDWVPREVAALRADWVDKPKVCLPKASDGSGRTPRQVLGRPIVAADPSCCTMTYLVVGPFDSDAQAASAAPYLHTKFVRFLVSLVKLTQDTTSSSFRFVPLVDFDRQWSDAALYELFDLSDDDIYLIEASITPM